MSKQKGRDHDVQDSVDTELLLASKTKDTEETKELHMIDPLSLRFSLLNLKEDIGHTEEGLIKMIKTREIKETQQKTVKVKSTRDCSKKNYQKNDFKEDDYKSNHFLYWLVEKHVAVLRETLPLELKPPEIRPLDYIQYSRRPFFDLWEKIQKKESVSGEDLLIALNNVLTQHFKEDRIRTALEDNRRKEEMKNIGIDFVNDVKEVHSLIERKAWEDEKFMEELHSEVKIVPLTQSGLLNRTYRSCAKRVVEVLRLMSYK